MSVFNVQFTVRFSLVHSLPYLRAVLFMFIIFKFYRKGNPQHNIYVSNIFCELKGRLDRYNVILNFITMPSDRGRHCCICLCLEKRGPRREHPCCLHLQYTSPEEFHSNRLSTTRKEVSQIPCNTDTHQNQSDKKFMKQSRLTVLIK